MDLEKSMRQFCFSYFFLALRTRRMHPPSARDRKFSPTQALQDCRISLPAIQSRMGHKLSRAPRRYSRPRFFHYTQMRLSRNASEQHFGPTAYAISRTLRTTPTNRSAHSRQAYATQHKQSEPRAHRTHSSAARTQPPLYT